MKIITSSVSSGKGNSHINNYYACKQLLCGKLAYLLFRRLLLTALCFILKQVSVSSEDYL